MPSSGYSVPDPENRMTEAIRKLQEDVRSLQQRPIRIPTVQADLTDGSSMWIMDDGRLRWRTRGGDVKEAAFTDHLHDNRYVQIGAPSTTPQGSGASTSPPPPPPYTPTTQVYQQQADWTQSYRLGGSAQRGGDGWLYYGYYSPNHNEQMSMAHFPGLGTLAPGPAGTRVAEVWLHIINQWTNGNSGGELRIGLHNVQDKPGSFTESEWPPFRLGVAKAGYPGSGDLDQWYQLPEWVGERMRDNAACGITLHQNSTSQAFYGYAKDFAELKIVFVK